MAKSGWHLCAFAVSLGIWGLSIVPKRRRALTSKLSGHFEARPQLYYCVPCWCSLAGAAMGLIRQFRNLRLLALSTLNQPHRKRPPAKAGGFLEQGNQPCNKKLNPILAWTRFRETGVVRSQLNQLLVVRQTICRVLPKLGFSRLVSSEGIADTDTGLAYRKIL
jgi:hypothetical protein